MFKILERARCTNFIHCVVFKNKGEQNTFKLLITMKIHKRTLNPRVIEYPPTNIEHLS